MDIDRAILLAVGIVASPILPVVLYEKWFLKKKIETFTIFASGILSAYGLVTIIVIAWSLYAASP